MITGAHAIIYSTKPEADRAFLRDVLKLTNVDVGEGWLIFGLPPSEVAVHPSQKNDIHELYLICDDVSAFVREMQRHGIPCSSAEDQLWGILTQLILPGGGRIGVYQPKHARPKARGAPRPARARSRGKRKPVARRAWRGSLKNRRKK